MNKFALLLHFFFIFSRRPDGSPASTWFAQMPWAVGCLLEGFCGEYWTCGDDNQI